MGIKDIKNIYVRTFLYTALSGVMLLPLSLAFSQFPSALVVIWGAYSAYVIWQCLALRTIYQSRKRYPMAQREQDLDDVLEILRENDRLSKQVLPPQDK